MSTQIVAALIAALVSVVVSFIVSKRTVRINRDKLTVDYLRRKIILLEDAKTRVVNPSHTSSIDEEAGSEISRTVAAAHAWHLSLSRIFEEIEHQLPESIRSSLSASNKWVTDAYLEFMVDPREHIDFDHKALAMIARLTDFMQQLHNAIDNELLNCDNRVKNVLQLRSVG